MKTTATGAGIVLCLAGILGLSPRAAAEPPVALQLRDLSGSSDQDRQLLAALYARRDFQPLWSVSGKPSRQAQAVVNLLATADTYGLRPEDYLVRVESGPIRNVQELAAADSTQAASVDLAISAAALRFLWHVHAGRVDPRAAGFDFGKARPPFEAGASLERLATAEDTGAVIAAVEPPFYHYRLLKDALVRYRRIADGAPLPRLPDLPGHSVRQGEIYAGAPALRETLIASGDLDASAALADTEQTLDPALVEAIRRFESRHQLDPDGVLGKAVLRELNVPIAQRVRQIELGLERWRWVPPFQAPPIIVNIPQFKLFAFASTQDRAADILQMDVIVGRAYRPAQTPVFAEDMKFVIFRPYWDVPYSIARKEILPKITANPAYLDKEHLELVSGPDDSAQLLPATNENLHGLVTGSVRLRQRPGPDNSLGLIKFMLPNAHNVYLHGTPARELFRRSIRAFSHGCIRVRDPVALAAFVLRDTPGEWTPERVEAAMNGPDSTRVNLRQPIPVMIVYATALATEAGQVLFFHDIYGYDRALEHLLGLAPVMPAHDRQGH
ncbi:MAG: murein L,D-transpeptidase [Steroidobacterales bacterium]